ncbi:hypothetical protein LK482_13340, partial [Ruminococcus callidus]|nr:hypothetical protein [Ruminococcus callidus]
KYSLRFLFHLTKNLTTHLSHNLCAVLPKANPYVAVFSHDFLQNCAFWKKMSGLLQVFLFEY